MDTSPLDNFKIVLSRPHYAGNIGSVCRAMKNMGLSNLVIATPRDDWYEDELRKMALSAIDLWDNRTEFATLAEAVADCGLVAATSARTGLYRDHAKTAREWTPFLYEKAAQGNKVAIVFGNEVSGLDNNELKLATQIIQIPSTEEYTSLNLSQAVMVCAYELYVESGQFEGSVERSEEANIEVREKMFEIWRDTMMDIGFMKSDKAEHMMLGLRRILSRGTLTDKDAKIMMGIARQAQWAASNHGDCCSD